MIRLNFIIFILLFAVTLSAQDNLKMPNRSTGNLKVPHNLFQKLDSIKGNPKKITEKSYGKLKKHGYSESKLSKRKTIYFYLDNNLIEQQINYFKRKKTNVETYKYDRKKNRISEISVNLENQDRTEFETQIKYDISGRTESIKEYSSNTGLMSKDIEFEYSQNADTISYINISYNGWKNDSTSSKIVKIHDSLNRLIEEYHSEVNQPHKTKWTFCYDKHSNLIEFYSQTIDHETKLLSKPIRQVFEYEYDEFGNWLFKYKMVDGKRVPLVQRKIEY